MASSPGYLVSIRQPNAARSGSGRAESAKGGFSSTREGSSESDCLVERGDLRLRELAVTPGCEAVEAQGAELGPDQADDRKVHGGEHVADDVLAPLVHDDLEEAPGIPSRADIDDGHAVGPGRPALGDRDTFLCEAPEVDQPRVERFEVSPTNTGLVPAPLFDAYYILLP